MTTRPAVKRNLKHIRRFDDVWKMAINTLAGLPVLQTGFTNNFKTNFTAAQWQHQLSDWK